MPDVPKNPRLRNAVGRALADYLKGKGATAVALKMLRDENHRIVLAAPPCVAYGYDFAEKDEKGIPGQELYRSALEGARRISGKRMLGTLAKKGVAQGRFGWYIVHYRE